MLLRLPKHICESELADTVAIRDVAVSPTELTVRFKDIILREVLHWLAMLFLKIVEIGLCKHKVFLVWIVLDRSPQHHGALLKLSDVLTLDKATLEFELVEQIIPQIVLSKHSCITKDHKTVLSTCQSDVEAPWVV